MYNSFHIHLSSWPLHEPKGLKMTPPPVYPTFAFYWFLLFLCWDVKGVSNPCCYVKWGCLRTAPRNCITEIWFMVYHTQVTSSDASNHVTPPSGWEKSFHILSHLEKSPQNFYTTDRNDSQEMFYQQPPTEALWFSVFKIQRQATVLLTKVQTLFLSVGCPVYPNSHQCSPGIYFSGYWFGKEENGFNYVLSKTQSYVPVLSRNRWFCI